VIRVVIDTNVFISSFFGGNPRKVISLWRDQKIKLCLSQPIVEEYARVLHRLLDDTRQVDNVLKLFAEGYNLVFTSKTPTLDIVKKDPDDNKFIECAVALDCDVVISGDKHLRDIKKYMRISILSPKEFIERFARKRF